ncbi:MAG: sigma-70 family RNA polymerase sigma factor [Clostridia bacterium]|nr:sigma-70 family RNA polymerase sigma factor [Clostridia bacterium]
MVDDERNPLEALLFTPPQQEEIEAAQRVCCGRSCSACEAPAAYAWRKRAVDLAALVDQAIRCELTAQERRAVLMHWYRGLSISETAQALGVSRPTVSVTLQRAQRRLEQVLRYVVAYQHDVNSDTLVPLAVRRAAAVASARARMPEAIGKRLRVLREREAIPCETAAALLSFSPERLAALEAGRVTLRTGELLKLSGFFQVSTDLILKGADRNDGSDAL